MISLMQSNAVGATDFSDLFALLKKWGFSLEEVQSIGVKLRALSQVSLVTTVMEKLDAPSAANLRATLNSPDVASSPSAVKQALGAAAQGHWGELSIDDLYDLIQMRVASEFFADLAMQLKPEQADELRNYITQKAGALAIHAPMIDA